MLELVYFLLTLIPFVVFVIVYNQSQKKKLFINIEELGSNLKSLNTILFTLFILFAICLGMLKFLNSSLNPLFTMFFRICVLVLSVLILVISILIVKRLADIYKEKQTQLYFILAYIYIVILFILLFMIMYFNIVEINRSGRIYINKRSLGQIAKKDEIIGVMAVEETIGYFDSLFDDQIEARRKLKILAQEALIEKENREAAKKRVADFREIYAI